MTNLDDFLRTKPFFLNFLPQPAPQDILDCILETATFTPSENNHQPWRFPTLTSVDVKVTLAYAKGVDFDRDLCKSGLSDNKISERLIRSRYRIPSTTVVIFLRMDNSDVDVYANDLCGQAKLTMTVQSSTLAGLRLMLATHAEGLGSVWTCGPLFVSKTVRFALNLPGKWHPQAIFFLVCLSKEPEPRARKSTREISIWM
jgi:hypothetical protein